MKQVQRTRYLLELVLGQSPGGLDSKASVTMSEVVGEEVCAAANR